jgi:hypothetical protein
MDRDKNMDRMDRGKNKDRDRGKNKDRDRDKNKYRNRDTNPSKCEKTHATLDNTWQGIRPLYTNFCGVGIRHLLTNFCGVSDLSE